MLLDPGSKIRDKHPGSATLSPLEERLCLQFLFYFSCDGLGSTVLVLLTRMTLVTILFFYLFLLFFITKLFYYAGDASLPGGAHPSQI